MWTYKNKPVKSIEELPHPEALHGFVYCISSNTGKIYIGKKNFYSNLKKKLTKKELALISDKRMKTYKRVSKESNWKNYWGSNTQLQSDISRLGADQFKREIIALAYSAKQLTYLETEHQILNDVLRSDNCYNDNISGKFFTKDLINHYG